MTLYTKTLATMVVQYLLGHARFVLSTVGDHRIYFGLSPSVQLFLQEVTVDAQLDYLVLRATSVHSDEAAANPAGLASRTSDGVH